MLKQFGNKLKSIFSSKIDESFFEDMEDLLVESDLGAILAIEVVDKLRESGRKERIKDLPSLKNLLKEILMEYIIEDELKVDREKLNLFLFLGVNGVGKTTTIGRLAHHFKHEHDIHDIVLSAGDTFRAAAIEQLQIHGERTGNRVVAQQHGADPGAVIFDTIKSAQAKGERLILADSAGRMHNKANLIKELEKINKIVLNAVDGENYKKILVVDCTTGQNALNQALQFNEAVDIDGVVLTKYDSSAKGGIIPAICNKLNVPFYYLGVGEKLEDIKPFNKEIFINELLDI